MLALRAGLAWCWSARELRLLPQVENEVAVAEAASGERDSRRNHLLAESGGKAVYANHPAAFVAGSQ